MDKWEVVFGYNQFKYIPHVSKYILSFKQNVNMLYYPIYVTFNKTTEEIYQPGDYWDSKCYRFI